MSHTYTGNATWFCCYPDPCGCDSGCCQGSNCNYAGCDQPQQSTAACCTCNSNSFGIAWKTNCPTCCNANNYVDIACGTWIDIWLSPDGSSQLGVQRVDQGPNTCAMIDYTKALFSYFAPLTQGVIYNVTVTVPV